MTCRPGRGIVPPLFLWIWIALVAAGSAFGQQASSIESDGKPGPHGVTGASTSGSLPTRPIGIIDFYGLHHLKIDRLRRALTFHEGDTITMGDHSFFAESERRLMALPGVLRARAQVVCCDDGRLIVYVGIEEQGAPILHFRSAPTGAIRLPREDLEAAAEFNRMFFNAVLRGHAQQESSEGQAMLQDASARPVEDHFIALARGDETRLLHVLHESADANQRAIAAQMLGYVKDKQSVVPDLVAAMSDPNAGVRNNAMRALIVFTMATKVPAPTVPVQPFVALLESPVWTDRNKASFALMSLARGRNPALLTLLRQRSLTPLVEMARWKNPRHAIAAFWILGYLAGLSDREIAADWKHGDREQVIRAELHH